jgi:hypothetical protein
MQILEIVDRSKSNRVVITPTHLFTHLQTQQATPPHAEGDPFNIFNEQLHPTKPTRLNLPTFSCFKQPKPLQLPTRSPLSPIDQPSHPLSTRPPDQRWNQPTNELYLAPSSTTTSASTSASCSTSACFCFCSSLPCPDGIHQYSRRSSKLVS